MKSVSSHLTPSPTFARFIAESMMAKGYSMECVRISGSISLASNPSFTASLPPIVNALTSFPSPPLPTTMKSVSSHLTPSPTFARFIAESMMAKGYSMECVRISGSISLASNPSFTASRFLRKTYFPRI
ncbi:uncharacterized protein LOC110099220 [Dendrobium catenatum]|uniref:uncharacterized protein LOC110099220 n=1 Tax=Dendrobium catenatum TaxID=906689 RepID=UPI00109F8CA8|nr:uncharacterized protein LOC110099220 [Dendrobium catenatum]